MRLKLEGPLPDESALRDDLGADDIGRTWWVGFVWYIWTGPPTVGDDGELAGGWQKAMVARHRGDS